MEIGSFLLILALLILVIFIVGQPLLGKQRSTPATGQAAQEHELSGLLAERDRTLNALQELDFDYTLGKIPEGDYPGQRARLLQYGADVLRKLDELQGPQAEAGPASGRGRGEQLVSAEERLETAIAAQRVDGGRAGLTPLPATNGGKVVPAAIAAPDDELEVLLASRRRNRMEDASGFCHQCGNPLQKSDKFCPKCGTKVN